jgi:hypothetical protein
MLSLSFRSSKCKKALQRHELYTCSYTCSKLECEPPNASNDSLLAAYEAYNAVYTQEVNALLMADKTKGKDAAQKVQSYQESKKREIKELAQSLCKDSETLSSRHTDVGRLLGLVSLYVF